MVSCDSGTRDDDEVTISETYDNRYTTEEEYAYEDEMIGIENDNLDVYEGTGTTGEVYTSTESTQGIGTGSGILSDSRYVCIDSTLVSDAGM